MSKAQISMWEEKIVDSFAGGGGASTGSELATGRVVDIAINHDPDAILMHKTNHPHTVHYQASVWDVDPLEVTGGSPVGLLWASPDCKHFSKAKGGKPVNKRIRGHLDRSALGGNGPPRVIILENVEEFRDMGASAPRTPGKGKDRANIPAVYWPTGGTGLCRRVAGTGGGGLWSANHPQTVFSDRPLRREGPLCGRNPPTRGGQPGGAGGAGKAVAERGGDHRLESPLPLHFRHAGGNPGEIRPFPPSGHSGPIPCAGWPGVWTSL